MTQGQRTRRYAESQHWRSRLNLVLFSGNLGSSEITTGKVQEYRIHRHQEAPAKCGKPLGGLLHARLAPRDDNLVIHSRFCRPVPCNALMQLAVQ